VGRNARPIPMFGLGVQEKSRPAVAQRRVNLYYELQQDQDRARWWPTRRPGLQAPFVNFGDTPVRGVIAPPTSNFAFFVHRGTLWQVDNAGVTTNRGTLNTTTGKVSMAENGTQIVIVDGTNGYVYNMSTLAFAQIVDADFPERRCDGVLDRRLFSRRGHERAFYISAYNDGTSWPGDFATAESNPDGIVRLVADRQDLIIMGSQSIEFWENTGAAAFLSSGCRERRSRGALLHVTASRCSTTRSPSSRRTGRGR
jgi:hypothetical protein